MGHGFGGMGLGLGWMLDGHDDHSGEGSCGKDQGTCEGNETPDEDQGATASGHASAKPWWQSDLDSDLDSDKAEKKARKKARRAEQPQDNDS